MQHNFEGEEQNLKFCSFFVGRNELDELDMRGRREDSRFWCGGFEI